MQKKDHQQDAAALRHLQREQMIVELTCADPNRIRTLASAFLKANETDMRQVLQLHEQGDKQGLRQIAHRIKGAAQMTGDTRLSALCSELGSLCGDPKLPSNRLLTCVQQLESAMREFSESCERLAGA